MTELRSLIDDFYSAAAEVEQAGRVVLADPTIPEELKNMVRREMRNNAHCLEIVKKAVYDQGMER